jgi:RNA polymerase sigma-70 factor (ECF subfamily)
MHEARDRVELVQELACHQGLIQAYAYAIVRDFHIAEDVYQDVALVLAERFEELPRGEALKPWLRETTRRKALEARRKQQKTGPLLSEDVLELLGGHFGETAAEEREQEQRRSMGEAMTHCLAQLHDAPRDVLEARYGRSLSCEQIAEQMGRTIQSIYALIKRARLSLAECVDRRMRVMTRGT